MTATAAMIGRLRRMVNEDSSSVYSDADLATYIEVYPVVDQDGNFPENPDWLPTYDVNAAAADIWEEKAARFAELYDFDADGGDYKRSQMVENAMRMAARYRARRSASTVRMIKYPPEGASDDGISDLYGA